MSAVRACQRVAVHITVAVVRYRTLMKAPRVGVCSTYLAALRSVGHAECVAGDTVGVWLRQGCLRLPAEPSAPLVMIGPGTGVAPFRAFVQTRQALRASVVAHGGAASGADGGAASGDGADGSAVGDACLFFGCRRAAHDYLYADDWQAHARRGDLQQLHVAFSREPNQPKVGTHPAAPCAATLR